MKAVGSPASVVFHIRFEPHCNTISKSNIPTRSKSEIMQRTGLNHSYATMLTREHEIGEVDGDPTVIVATLRQWS